MNGAQQGNVAESTTEHSGVEAKQSGAITINNNAMKEERSNARHSSLTVSLICRSGRIESDALHAERDAGSSPRGSIMLPPATVSALKSDASLSNDTTFSRSFRLAENKRMNERTNK